MGFTNVIIETCSLDEYFGIEVVEIEKLVTRYKNVMRVSMGAC